MRRALLGTLLLLAAGVVLVLGTGAGSGGGVYRVRAIFDNASFVVSGEDVKVAGVKVGTIQSLDVTPDRKAAVVLAITDMGFSDFRKDAHCTIRPQSLIGEQFVECTPTQPRAPGQKPAPKLDRVPKGEPGAGQVYLPVQNTSSPVGIDLVGDNLRMTERQRLSLIINELGTGLAGNGQRLASVIRRANPALAQLDRVLKVLASENQRLASLARDSDTNLQPLARNKRQLADFITKAKNTAQATAERRGDLERNFQRLPTFLTELRVTAPKLINFSDQATPVLADLRLHAGSINTLIQRIGPFSQASLPAFRSLGQAGKVGGPALVSTRPLARTLNSLGQALQPLAKETNALLQNFRSSGGVEGLMRFIFFQDAAINGYDSVSHYLRAGLIGAIPCQPYTATAPGTTPATNNGCSANFNNQLPPGASAARSRYATPAQQGAAFMARMRQLGLLPQAGKTRPGPKAAAFGGAAAAKRSAPAGATPAAAASPATTTTTAPAPAPTNSTGDATQGAGDASGLLQYLLGGGGQ